MFLRLVRALPIAAIVVGAGCGGSDDKPPDAPPSGGGGGNPIQVTGGERFGWSQAGPNAQSVQQYQFVVYLDNVRSTLAGVQCATVSSGGHFDCSAPLPQMSLGRHTLAIAAVNTSGREGAMSQPMALNVVTRSTSSARPSEPVVLERTCTGEGAGATCYLVDVLVRGLDQPSGLLSLGDGRLIIIERRSELLLLNGHDLTQAYLLPSDFGTSIESVALATDFEKSRRIYAAIAAERNERRTLSIVSFREVAGTLGEAAIIVPDLPMEGGSEAALSVGGDQHLYVAMPASNQTRAGDEGGVVLRFDSSGAAKGQERMAFPVLAEASPRPARLVWQDGQLWLAGLAAASSPALRRFPPAAGTASEWPLRPAAIDVNGFPSLGWGIRDLAASGGAADSPANLFAVLENPHELYRAPLEQSGATTALSFVRIPLGALVPRAVTTSQNGEVFVAAGTGSDEPESSMILRLRPESVRRAAPR